MVIKIPNQACKAGEACEACQTHFLIKIFRIIKKRVLGDLGHQISYKKNWQKSQRFGAISSLPA